MSLDFDLLGDPIPEGHGEPGRPAHVATERNRQKTVLLLACGWAVTRIASAIGVTAKTLRKHYSPELRARAVALDKIRAGHLTLLWEEGQKGNVAALKEIGKVIHGLEAANFGAADPRPVRIPKAAALGKKDEAKQRAKNAGVGSDWANDLQPSLVN